MAIGISFSKMLGKYLLLFGVMWLLTIRVFASDTIRTIHVFVALCDNENQGIVPVPKTLGNGKDIKNNLYWGAAYGVKSFFKYKASEWKLVAQPEPGNPYILERLLFKHVADNVYLLADAYDGARIKECTIQFLKSSNGQNTLRIQQASNKLVFGGGSDLVAYIGHNGLMDFSVTVVCKRQMQFKKDVIILACYSKSYFAAHIRRARANPLVWTTHLMAPEAYTLKSIIDGWMLGETGEELEERAAQTYNAYQKCGINGARNLFTSGF